MGLHLSLRRARSEPSAFTDVYAALARRRSVERLGIQIQEVGEDDYERIVELAGLSDLRGRVADAFAELDPDAQAAVRLRVIDERSYAEVASELGISEQTARARVSRALRRMAVVA